MEITIHLCCLFLFGIRDDQFLFINNYLIDNFFRKKINRNDPRVSHAMGLLGAQQKKIEKKKN